jgi:plasmid maintenance system killer protein
VDRFGDGASRLIWEGKANKAARRILPFYLHAKAAKLIDRLLNTASLRDCSHYPPGWRFKELRGKLRGSYQIRIDGQFRIRFRWDRDEGAIAISVGEFHGEDD